MGIQIKDIEILDYYVNYSDYPDFSDSYIISAVFKDNKRELSESELDSIDTDGFYEYILNNIY